MSLVFSFPLFFQCEKLSLETLFSPRLHLGYKCYRLSLGHRRGEKRVRTLRALPGPVPVPQQDHCSLNQR